MQTTKGLEYEVQGDGEPVLLIHGSILADGHLPFMNEPTLANYKLVRYHRRGFAGSDHHEGSFSIEQQAGDALAVLQELGIERAHICGHSYGGPIALQLAVDVPEVVQSLVLEEPALFMVPGAAEFFTAMGPVAEKYSSGDSAGAIHDFMDMMGSGWEEYVSRNLPGGVAQAEADAETFFKVEMPALQEWQFDEIKAKAIAQPVVCVLGSETAPVFKEGAGLLQTWLPQTEVLVVDGLGHPLQVEDPAAVAPGVADFLARHPF